MYFQAEPLEYTASSETAGRFICVLGDAANRHQEATGPHSCGEYKPDKMEKEKAPYRAPSFLEKELLKLEDDVTLTATQAVFCQTVLSQALSKISILLASGKEANGDPLDLVGERALVDFSTQLQLNLLALGMSPEKLAEFMMPVVSAPQE